jgi:RNA polymerase sigma factor (sigma-70 family)
MDGFKTMREIRKVALLNDELRITDGELLESFISERNETALEVLIHRHGPMVLGVCRRVLGHHHDAEDAFQATFLVLVLKASSVSPRERVGNWLHGVAYHIALKAKALAARRLKREKQFGDVPDPAAAPQHQDSELQTVLDQELRCVPVNYRLPVLLCDVEGKTIREAATQLGWLQGTLAGRLARGRKMLAKRLTRRGVGLAGGLSAALLSQNVAPGCVPAPLVSATLEAVASTLANKSPVGRVVSPNVAILMEGAKTGMMPIKFKILIAVLLAFSGVALGGLLMRYSPALHVKSDKPEAKTESPAEEKSPQSLEEKLQGEWILKFKEDFEWMGVKYKEYTLCYMFGADRSFRRINDVRLAFPHDEGTYSVDWDKTPYHLKFRWKNGDDPPGYLIMEFTADGKLRMEEPTDFENEGQKFTEKSWVLTRKGKPPAGSKQAAEDAAKDLEIAASYRRSWKFAAAHFYYQLVETRYPGTPYARTAKEATDDLKKKYLGTLKDGTAVWATAETPEEAVLLELVELKRQLQMLEDRLAEWQDKQINQPPPKIIGEKQDKAIDQPPPKKIGENAKSVSVTQAEIDEVRKQIKNLESAFSALEAKGNRLKEK